MLNIWDSMLEKTAQGEGHIIARVVSTWGSAPRPVGSAMLISPGNDLLGSVSGGCVEPAVIQKAEEVRCNGASAYCEFGVSDELAWSVGLSCGGQVKILVEPHWSVAQKKIWQAMRDHVRARRSFCLVTCLEDSRETWLVRGSECLGESAGSLPADVMATSAEATQRSHSQLVASHGRSYFLHVMPAPDHLLVIGSGHISVPLSKFAVQLGFSVTVIDPRPAFLNTEELERAGAQALSCWPEQFFEQLVSFDNLYAALISHDPKIDDPVFPWLFKNNVRYIGALGGKKTRESRKARLLAAGFTEAQIRSICSPIGLDIGAVTADEIALSIISEVIKTKNTRQ